MAVRDYLKRVGKKPLYNSWGESADYGTVFRGGIPRAFISHLDRTTKPAADSSKPVKSSLIIYSVNEYADCSDCSAYHHPVYPICAKIRKKQASALAKLRKEAAKEAFCAMADVLSDIWEAREREGTKLREQPRYKARLLFLKALCDPCYTSIPKYAQQT